MNDQALDLAARKIEALEKQIEELHKINHFLMEEAIDSKKKLEELNQTRSIFEFSGRKCFQYSDKIVTIQAISTKKICSVEIHYENETEEIKE